MEEAAARVRAELGARGVWVWLPDKRCLVPMQFATDGMSRGPGGRCISPSRCDSPPRDSQIHYRPPCTSPPPCYGPLKRGLSQNEIQERLSASTGEMFSPETKVATPETPSAGAMKRRKSERAIEPVNVPELVLEPIQECKHDVRTGTCDCMRLPNYSSVSRPLLASKGNYCSVPLVGVARSIYTVSNEELGTWNKSSLLHQE